MCTSNIDPYEHEGFIEVDKENEFNFYLKCNEHEEIDLSDNLEIIGINQNTSIEIIFFIC